MAKFNNILILFTILLATFAGLAPLAGQERVWTSGPHQISADFVKLENGIVFLKTDKGVIEISIDRLSEGDQQYVRELDSSTPKTEIPDEEKPAPANEEAIGEERIWTSGQYQISAKFIKLENGEVFLETAKGVIQVPIDRFSEVDQQYVSELVDPTPAVEDPVAEEPVTEEPVEAFTPKIETGPTPKIETGRTPKIETGPTPKIATPIEVEQTPRPRGDDSAIAIRATEAIPHSELAPIKKSSNIDPARLSELPQENRATGAILINRENVIVVNRAFETIAQMETVPPLFIEIIEELAESSNKHIRTQSLKLLARFNSNDSLPRIIEAMSDESSFDVRWTALELVEYLQDVRTIDPLIERLSSKDNGKVTKVLISFGSLVEERVFPFLESESRLDIANAVKILASVGTEKSIQKLTPLLDSESTSTRLMVKSALRTIKTRLGQQP